MYKIVVITLALIIVLSISQAQNRISINLGSGSYLYNSENSLPLMENKDHSLYLTFGVQYQKNNVFGYDIGIEYSFNESAKTGVLTMFHTDEQGNVLGKFGVNAILMNHNFDFYIYTRTTKYFLSGFGPSFVITNRIIEVDKYLYDKLASSGIGINAFIEFRTPLGKTSVFNFSSKLKFRYTHSIWFDEGLRDLSDYSQSFYTAELLIGFGYAF